MKKFIIAILIIFALINCVNALSENIILSGQINSWHDGPIKDRASGTGTIEYAMESYSGGLSSGFNLSDGSGSYFFKSPSYSLSLSDFSGSIIAESNDQSTTVDGNGTGILRTKSYENYKWSLLSNGFPSGELNANGIWEIHATSARRIVDVSSEWQPNLTTETKLINNSTEYMI